MNSIPGSVKMFQGFDKIVHLGIFFVLTILIFFGIQSQHKSYRYSLITLIKILLFTFFVGSIIELLQWKVFTYRAGDWWDLFADMLGVLMAMFSFVVLHLKTEFTFLSSHE